MDSLKEIEHTVETTLRVTKAYLITSYAFSFTAICIVVALLSLLSDKNEQAIFFLSISIIALGTACIYGINVFDYIFVRDMALKTVWIAVAATAVLHLLS